MNKKKISIVVPIAFIIFLVFGFSNIFVYTFKLIDTNESILKSCILPFVIITSICFGGYISGLILKNFVKNKTYKLCIFLGFLYLAIYSYLICNDIIKNEKYFIVNKIIFIICMISFALNTILFIFSGLNEERKISFIFILALFIAIFGIYFAEFLIDELRIVLLGLLLGLLMFVSIFAIVVLSIVRIIMIIFYNNYDQNENTSTQIINKVDKKKKEKCDESIPLYRRK